VLCVPFVSTLKAHNLFQQNLIQLLSGKLHFSFSLFLNLYCTSKSQYSRKEKAGVGDKESTVTGVEFVCGDRTLTTVVSYLNFLVSGEQDQEIVQLFFRKNH